MGQYKDWLIREEEANWGVDDGPDSFDDFYNLDPYDFDYTDGIDEFYYPEPDDFDYYVSRKPSKTFGFHTKIVGVTHGNRQQLIKSLKIGDVLTFQREPNNQYDRNAIAIMTTTGEQLGYISKELAEKLAPKMDIGINFEVKVSNITGGTNGMNYGVNIFVESK